MSSGPRYSRAAQDLSPSVFADLQTKINGQRLSGDRLVPLHIGDTHLPPAAQAEAALLASSVDDLRVYGSPAGLAELNAALAARARSAGRAWVRSAANVHVTCGATQALLCATRALLDPHDQVLVLSPYWPLIRGIFESSRVDMVEVPVPQGLYAGTLSLSDALEEAYNPRVRAVYFASPNNPDGYVFSNDELKVLADFALRHDLWLLSDEVYSDYVYEGHHQSIADLPGVADRTVVAHSFSKSHGLAGARIGYLLASEGTISRVRRMANYTLYNVPVAMQRVALAALSEGDAWQAEAYMSYRQARDLTCEHLEQMAVPHYRPHGGSFVFCDFSQHLGEASMLQLLEAAIDQGVLLAPGRAFGEVFERHCRLCYTGVAMSDLMDGLARLSRALERVV